MGAIALQMALRLSTPPKLARGAGPLSRYVQLCFRLIQPEPHPHLAIRRRRDREMLLRALARAPVELAEAEVAVGNERAHAKFAGERQRLAIVAFSVLGAACRRDVTGEAEGVGLASPSPQPAGERQSLSGVAGGLVDPPGRESPRLRDGRTPDRTSQWPKAGYHSLRNSAPAGSRTLHRTSPRIDSRAGTGDTSCEASREPDPGTVR